MKIVYRIASIIARGVFFALIYCLSVIISEALSMYHLVKMILHPSKNQYEPQKAPVKSKNI